MKIYAIKDEVTGFQPELMVFHNEEEAKRVFGEAATDERSRICKWAKDFSLWEIGMIDRKTGHLTEKEPSLVVRADSWAKNAKKEVQE